METLETLRRKIEGAEDLNSVVRTMKTMAASNIGQFEMAVKSLDDYNRAVNLGFLAFLRQEKEKLMDQNPEDVKERPSCCIVFGSDQGLVGKFNTSLVDFVAKSLTELPGSKEIWTIGERVKLLFGDKGIIIKKFFSVPNSVDGISSLVEQILLESEENLNSEKWSEIYIYHNQPKSMSGYEPVYKQLLPLDQKWKVAIKELEWPTENLPEVIGARKTTLIGLVHEYLFITLFKAAAESMASENASRLAAMQRAEKNIGKLLDELNRKYHHMRQNAIDEELFDIVSGFEALRNLKTDEKTEQG